MDAKTENKKRMVELELKELYRRAGIDTPENHSQILDYVFRDVDQAAHPEDWHSGDVAIGFRRYLERESTAYILVPWPDVQQYMEEDWFEREAYLNDMSSYFLPINRL